LVIFGRASAVAGVEIFGTQMGTIIRIRSENAKNTDNRIV